MAGNNEGLDEDSESIGKLPDERRHSHDGNFEDEGQSPGLGSDGPLM